VFGPTHCQQSPYRNGGHYENFGVALGIALERRATVLIMNPSRAKPAYLPQKRRAFWEGGGSRTPAGGAVRLASDSRPAAGRSLQPDEKLFQILASTQQTIHWVELFETKFAPLHWHFPHIGA